LVIVTVAPATTAPLLSVTVPSKLAPYWAWTNAVNATMLTISSTMWTAKLGRLMESPRIERVLLFNANFGMLQITDQLVY
jgi:hypothetical protein